MLRIKVLIRCTKCAIPLSGHLSRLDSLDPLLLLDVVVEAVGPLAHASDVQGEVFALFRRRAEEREGRLVIP